MRAYDDALIGVCVLTGLLNEILNNHQRKKYTFFYANIKTFLSGKLYD